jgi:hypothetical protein
LCWDRPASNVSIGSGSLENTLYFLIPQQSFQEDAGLPHIFTSLHRRSQRPTTYMEVTSNNLRTFDVTRHKSMSHCYEPFLSGRSLTLISLREISAFVTFHVLHKVYQRSISDPSLLQGPNEHQIIQKAQTASTQLSLFLNASNVVLLKQSFRKCRKESDLCPI